MKLFQRCPKPDSLKSFLDEALSESESSKLSSHIEHCKKCQSQLDALTSDDPFEDSTPSNRIDSDSSLHKLVNRLKTEKSPFDSDDSLNVSRAQNSGRLRTKKRKIVQPPADGEGIPLDHYRLLEVIGSGASGVVYKASDTKLDRTVAIKLLRGELVAGDDSVARLEREAKSIAGLSHPNVLSVFELGQGRSPDAMSQLLPSTPYLVTEFVDGDSLAQRLDEDGSLPQAWVVKLVRDVAQGLHAAHQAGLIHRDIKPSNILIARKSDQPKIADFGLAIDEQFQSRLTHEGMIAGTPAYMSPEQIQTLDQIDFRADVYSLGVVLYECLTGEVPFRGVARATIDRVLYEQPRDPQLLNPQIARDISSVCLKAISKQPERRYQTALEFAEDLDRWLNKEPVLARPISNWERLGWWIQQNRLAAVLAGMAATLMITLAVASVIYAVNMQSANRVTQAALYNEQRQSLLVEKQRDALLNSIEKLVYRVNDILEVQDGTSEAQRRLLTIALGGLETVAATSDRGSLDRHTADIHLRMGMVQQRLDELEEAARHFEISESTARNLIAREMETPELTKLLARSQWWAGSNAYELDRLGKAERHWQAAESNSVELTANSTNDAALVEDIAFGKLNYAIFEVENGNYVHAKQLLNSTLKMTDRLEQLADYSEVRQEQMNRMASVDFLRPKAYSYLARAYYEDGNQSKASEYDFLCAKTLAEFEPFELFDPSHPAMMADEFLESDENDFSVEDYWLQRLKFTEKNSPGETDNLDEKATCNRMLVQLYVMQDSQLLALDYAKDAMIALERILELPNPTLDQQQLAIVARAKYATLLRTAGDNESAELQLEPLDGILDELVSKYRDHDSFDAIRWRARVEFEINRGSAF